MSFLIDKSKQSTVLQRRQDLPENAFVSPLFLKSLVAEASPLLSDFDGVLPIIAVSACWLSSSHPDPRGEQLRIIGQTLEREAHKYRAETAGGRGFSECGVFWDWVSLHQPEESGEDKGRRRPNEQVQYDSALRDMDLWFGHVGTVALLLTQPPVPSLEIVGNGGALLGGRIRKKELRKQSRTYHRSGWTTYESTAAALKQFFRPRRHMQAATWQLVVECGLASADGEPAAEQKGSEWQFELTAADFGARLASKSFAHEADRAICVKLYERQVSATLGGLSSLVLQFPMPLGASPLPPVDARAATLLGRLADRKLCGRLLDLQLVRVPGLSDSFGAFCAPLIANGRMSGPMLNHLSALCLDGNRIGDVGLKALAKAAEQGALRALEKLSLGGNHLGGEGVKALAFITTQAAPNSVAALEKLRELNLYDNRLGPSGSAMLSDELARGAFGSLQRLYLGRNAIGTEGLKSLAACLLVDEDGDGSGALAELRCLHLYKNDIGTEAATKLGKALHGWGLQRVTEIVLDGNDVTTRATKFVRDALERRAWARIMLHQWQQAIRNDHRSKLSTYGRRELERQDQHTNKGASRSPRRRRGAERSGVKALSMWHVHSSADVE